jgi:hypothetical protein
MVEMSQIANCVQKLLIFFNALLLSFSSLMMVTCGLKHVEMVNVMLLM